MTKLDLITTEAERFFSEKGLATVAVPILQPADPFLDMAGEDLRRNIFMTENENGDSLCLRPEFTIPVCMKHIANGTHTPHRYAYIGEVFRQRREGGNSFFQAGIEDFGDSNEAEADARTLYDALELIARIAPSDDDTIVLGDQAVFAAILAELGIAHGWQKKLLRAFGNQEQLRNLLQALSAPKREQILPDELKMLVQAQDEQALINYLEEEMLSGDMSPSSGRTPAEIAKRLLEKQQLSSARLIPSVLQALEEFLSIQITLDKAEQQLADFGRKHHLPIDHFLALFEARNSALVERGVKLSDIRYDAAFGRPLDYYTGLVYEVRRDNRFIVGGGRYDRLMTMLGAKKSIPAVGFSIWLDRLTDGIAAGRGEALK